MTKKYNLGDIEPFKGKTFVTKHQYSIDSNGRILGRPSIEGAKVEYVAGFESKYFYPFRFALGDKQKLDELIFDVGMEPRPGLHLVVSLTHESSKEKERNGLITSRIKRVEELVEK